MNSYFRGLRCNQDWQELESEEAKHLRGHGPSYFKNLLIAERGRVCEGCKKKVLGKGFFNGLHVHHLLKIRTHRHLRFERSNVMLVCRGCHKELETESPGNIGPICWLPKVHPARFRAQTE